MARRTKSQLLPAKLGPIYLIFGHFDLVWWPLMEMARGKNKTNENETIRNIHINKSACFIIHPPLDRNEKKVWTFSDRLTHGQLMEEIKFHPLASRFIFIRSQSYLNYLFIKNFVFAFPIAGWRLQGLHCYRFFEVQHSWERAADLCKRWVPILFDFFVILHLVFLSELFSLMETDKIGFGKLLRESYTTPTLHRSLTLLVGNISRPPLISHANRPHCRRRQCREGLSPASFWLSFRIKWKGHPSFVILSP